MNFWFSDRMLYKTFSKSVPQLKVLNTSRGIYCNPFQKVECMRRETQNCVMFVVWMLYCQRLNLYFDWINYTKCLFSDWNDVFFCIYGLEENVCLEANIPVNNNIHNQCVFGSLELLLIILNIFKITIAFYIHLKTYIPSFYVYDTQEEFIEIFHTM